MIAPGFTGGTLDRDDRVRHEPELLAAALADPRARLLVLDGLVPTLDGEGRLVWTGLDAATQPLLFLGFIDGEPRFVQTLAPGTPLPPGRPPELSAILDAFRPEDAANYAAARSLIDWHARHGFCARCGTPSDIFRAGWGRLCPNCGTEHYPRVDPVVIMLAEYQDRVLVGRQPGFPPGFFSALAGFVEPGESLEEAVARELFEEAGIQVSDVVYVASQPWPFPSSLMIGCRAVAHDTALTIDTTELEAAMWVDRAEVRAALAGEMGASFMAPPPLAIARYLLEDWAG